MPARAPPPPHARESHRRIGLLLARSKAFLKLRVASTLYRIVFVLDAALTRLARLGHGGATRSDVVFVKTDNLGDFVLWLPVAKALREQWPWPERRFVLVANAAWSGFARGLAIFDEVVAVDTVRVQRNPVYRAGAIIRLARMSASLVVTPILARNPTTADSIARAIRAPCKMAVREDPYPTAVSRSVSGSWYTDLIGVAPAQVHDVFGNKQFIERALAIEIRDLWPALPVPLSRSGCEAIPPGGYVVMAPGAVLALKRWPAASFAALADLITGATSLRIVLAGTSRERPETAAVAQRCAVPPLDLTGQLDLHQFQSLLGRARMIVTNDSGTAHLGAAMRVPTLAIVGGAQFGRFMPYPAEAEAAGIVLVSLAHPMPCYHCHWRCSQPVGLNDPAPCVAGVSVETAWAAAERMLRSA